MTDAQENAMTRINDILKEHFDASVVIVMGDAVPTEEITQQEADGCRDHEFAYHGGWATCLGLVEMLKFKIYKEGTANERDPS